MAPRRQNREPRPWYSADVKKKRDRRKGGPRVVYVGFLNYRPHLQVEAGARVMAVYLSRAAARRAYADVRRARLVVQAAEPTS